MTSLARRHTHKLIHTLIHKHGINSHKSTIHLSRTMDTLEHMLKHACAYTHMHTHTKMHAHSHVAVSITSVTDGFSSSSVLNEYKYVCLTSFICQRGTHLPHPAKRGSVTLCSAGEGCIWKQQTEEEGEREWDEKTCGDKDGPRASNKASAKE